MVKRNVVALCAAVGVALFHKRLVFLRELGHELLLGHRPVLHGLQELSVNADLLFLRRQGAAGKKQKLTAIKADPARSFFHGLLELAQQVDIGLNPRQTFEGSSAGWTDCRLQIADCRLSGFAFCKLQSAIGLRPGVQTNQTGVAIDL